MLFILISTCLAQLIIPNIEQGIAPAPVVGIVGNIPSAPLIQAPGTKKEDNHVPHLHNDAFGEFIFDLEKKTDDVIIKKLETIEAVVHNYDDALNFIKSKDAVSTIFSLINNQNPTIRKFTALIIGSLASNNFEIQKILNKHDVLSLLLNKLENETLDEVIKELVYALGSQLRGYVEEIKSFNEKDGTTILLNVYVKVTDKPRIKILILLADLSNPDMNSGESETLGFTDEKLRPWCVLVLEEMKRSKMVGPDAYEFALALHKRPNCCKPPLVLLPFKKKFEDDY